MAYQCEECKHWTADQDKHQCELESLRAKLADAVKEKEHWYTEFCKLDLNQASCCTSNEEKLADAIRSMECALKTSSWEHHLVECLERIK
jgi:hypothetical protein